MRKWAAAVALLLTFAIPVQGFAAAMQSGCALGHLRTDSRSNSSSTASHSHHKHNGHAATPAAASQTDADADSEDGATVECQCGTSSLGTALPISKRAAPLAPLHVAPLARPVNLQVIMITGGPERPPRSFLA